MKSAVFVSARTKSTRLPRKVLLDIKGKATIEHLIERAKQPELTDMVIMCTSVHPGDDPLYKIAKKNDIECFRGSPEDKLDRYLNAVYKYELDYAVIMDGDNVFMEPEIVDRIIKRYQETGADYVACKDLPVGAAPHGLSREALERVCEIKSESDTEVWGGYFVDTGLFKVEYLEFEEELRHPEMRLTLDYHEDFDLLQEIFNILYTPGEVFSLRDVISLLVKNPELMKINSHKHQEYLEHLKESAPVRIDTSTNI
ncbi:cytidylyltransferase domain-containing protein [Chloroflexota bacterium]